jgi:hypothetical protein
MIKVRSITQIIQDAKYKRPLISRSGKPYIPPTPVSNPTGDNLLTENDLPILTENNLNITV